MSLLGLKGLITLYQDIVSLRGRCGKGRERGDIIREPRAREKGGGPSPSSCALRLRIVIPFSCLFGACHTGKDIVSQ